MPPVSGRYNIEMSGDTDDFLAFSYLGVAAVIVEIYRPKAQSFRNPERFRKNSCRSFAERFSWKRFRKLRVILYKASEIFEYFFGKHLNLFPDFHIDFSSERYPSGFPCHFTIKFPAYQRKTACRQKELHLSRSQAVNLSVL